LLDFAVGGNLPFFFLFVLNLKRLNFICSEFFKIKLNNFFNSNFMKNKMLIFILNFYSKQRISFKKQKH
jgi:hypothetical protein